MKLSVAILISGSGSNMVQLIKSMDNNHPAFPSIVISNKPNAAGIKKAQDLGVPTEIISKNFNYNNFSTKLEQNKSKQKKLNLKIGSKTNKNKIERNRFGFPFYK